MGRKILLILLLVFIAGWLSSSTWSKMSYHNLNAIGKNKFLYNKIDNLKEAENLKEFERIENLFAETKTKEKYSPYDWIKPGQINVYENEVVLKIDNPEWAIYTDTNSMDPVIDSTSNAIEIIPKSTEDIHIGDIVAYNSEFKEGVITHRVTNIDNDGDGWYATLKGDNNEKPDPGKIRFGQIKRVVVAVIY